jgi:hypothetical protein
VGGFGLTFFLRLTTHGGGLIAKFSSLFSPGLHLIGFVFALCGSDLTTTGEESRGQEVRGEIGGTSSPVRLPASDAGRK